MADTFTVDELAAYPGVAASPATLDLVAGIINALIAELIETYGDPRWPARVRVIALGAAASFLVNPDGATTTSIQIDDFKETRVYSDGSVRRGWIGFTAEEMGWLMDAILGVSPRVGSIQLVVPGYPACTAREGYGVGGWLVVAA